MSSEDLAQPRYPFRSFEGLVTDDPGVLKNIRLPDHLELPESDEEMVKYHQELTAQARQTAQREKERADIEHRRAETFAAKLRELGMDPNELEPR